MMAKKDEGAQTKAVPTEGTERRGQSQEEQGSSRNELGFFRGLYVVLPVPSAEALGELAANTVQDPTSDLLGGSHETAS